MPLRLVPLLLLLFCYPCTGKTGYTYDYNGNCTQAYLHYMSLHFREADMEIGNELKNNPGNLMAVYLADYEDCIVLLLNCDPAEYEKRRPHLDQRLDLLEKGDPASPWYRFCKAGVYLHWAIINVRFGEQYKAALNFHRSFALIKENKELFPAFEYNSVIAGLEEAVAGSLPGSYKWLASIAGIRGDVKKGTGQLAAFVGSHTAQQALYTETVLFYLYARFYLLAEQKEVWDFISSDRFDTRNNLLNTFVKANIALDFRKADAAMAALQAAAAEPGYTEYPVFDYQAGMALVARADTGCAYYLQQYLRKNKSNIYIKDCWQKMAIVWYVNNNMPNANYCLGQVATKGTARLDADKQAYRFAQSGVWPMRQLLQVRMYTDGGYNDKALAVLQGINPTTLSKEADRAEYFFRTGRVYEAMAEDNSKQYFQLALKNYREAMSAGKDRHEQFAARAALQMGKMYEQIGLNAEAINKYKECLDMPAHDFQNSIDQQAKAGINRVEGK